jgi:hypothetical protein
MQHTQTRSTGVKPRHASVSSDHLTAAEAAALVEIYHRDAYSQAEVDALRARSSRPGWSERLVERYQESKSDDPDPDCYQRKCFADTMRCFGPAAQSAVPRCVRDLRLPDLDHYENTDDHGGVSADQVRWSALRMIAACGSVEQVADVMPDALRFMAVPEDRDHAFHAQHLAQTVSRFAGPDRQRIIAAIRHEIPHESRDALTTKEFVAGRMLQELGDDHPVALAWVKAQVSGTKPLRADAEPVEGVGRVASLLTWCEAQVDQQRFNLLQREDVLSTLMSVAADGALPVHAGSPPTIQPQERERAGRLIGIIAARSV